MSLTGKVESNYTLRGTMNMLEKLQGYSAYEIAVINGFEGTEAEWLESLRGVDGKDGYGAIIDDLTTGGNTAALSAGMGKLLEQSKVPAVTVYYSSEMSADDLTVPLALITYGQANAELKAALGGSNAYVRTIFYHKVATTVNRMQIACSYRSTSPKMVFRVYHSGDGGWSAWREMAGTDNALLKADKPSGSYSGTGGAHNVTIGGVGEAVLIKNTDRGLSAIVVFGGAISFNAGTITGHSWTEAQYVNGVLRLNTANVALNASPDDGKNTYYYQVL